VDPIYLSKVGPDPVPLESRSGPCIPDPI
jgi:hypothetical protein